MPTIMKILRNEYYDSVTLMSLTAELKSQSGAEQVVVLMGTDMNKDMLKDLGFDMVELQDVSAHDCVIGVSGEKCDVVLLNHIVHKLQHSSKLALGGKRRVASTIKGVLSDFGATIAVISTPGQYAAREAEMALRHGLHVMIFSDNVPVADEKRLKQMARAHGLLLMGPDCGTAIINGVGLCFANSVRKGTIGLVAASGTGLQEVSVLIHKYGGGVSQAIGVGGRDLSVEIGGIMMLEGIRALAEDASTKVIVLVSKPPAREVQCEVLDLLSRIEKPVVICFLDGESPSELPSGKRFVTTLEAAAYEALGLAGMRTVLVDETDTGSQAEITAVMRQLHPSQRFIRGLYCGGTLCAEAVSLARSSVGPIFSNVSKRKEEKLLNPLTSQGHCFVDLGDDIFTEGKPHPMIDPSIRLARIVEEARDPETAVLLLDFVLGYGSHPDPVGVAMPTIRLAQQVAKLNGGHLAIVGYICGTALDKQDYNAQHEKLRSLGVITARSNANAVQIACQIALGGG